MFNPLKYLSDDTADNIEPGNDLLTIKSNKVIDYSGVSYIYVRNPKNPLVFKFIILNDNIDPKKILDLYYNLGWYCGHIAGGLLFAMKKRISTIDDSTIHIV